eukprot:GHVO01018147.1.p1 GENE.GHVO01018147.1~~GHVO01018147.1.p1  ORF type:complete len:281 (-),score=64.45 GHVO01018147.1:406-1248(-)
MVGSTRNREASQSRVRSSSSPRRPSTSAQSSTPSAGGANGTRSRRRKIKTEGVVDTPPSPLSPRKDWPSDAARDREVLHPLPTDLNIKESPEAQNGASVLSSINYNQKTVTSPSAPNEFQITSSSSPFPPSIPSGIPPLLVPTAPMGGPYDPPVHPSTAYAAIDVEESSMGPMGGSTGGSMGGYGDKKKRLKQRVSMDPDERRVKARRGDTKSDGTSEEEAGGRASGSDDGCKAYEQGGGADGSISSAEQQQLTGPPMPSDDPMCHPIIQDIISSNNALL